MADYSKLSKVLKEKNIKKSILSKELGISSRTIAKIAKGEPLSDMVCEKISNYLDYDPEELFGTSVTNPLLFTLLEEKNAGISGGIYHELQVRMTYNSNHMEGSRLTEEQTRMIFETNTIDAGDGILIDDILETVHHFRAVDYCIDHAKEPLTEDFVKQLHYILKHDTKDTALPWFAVGDYKKRPNMVGGRETTRPDQVQKEIQILLKEYKTRKRIQIEDIIRFHARFEQIHPFQDGNGRVGRLIAFKECLKHDLVPFIIEDRKKAYYYRGLSNWDSEPGYLLDTCLDGQDTVRAILNYYEIITKP